MALDVKNGRTVTAAEANNRLDELLDSVHAGQEIAIERGGEVAAVLVPPAQWEEWVERRRAEARDRFFAMVDEIHAANAHIPEEEVLKEVAAARARVRSDT